MKKGISLIVLVITIIVMIIIAGAIIISLNNTNLIRQSNEAVRASNEAEANSYLSMLYAEVLCQHNLNENEAHTTNPYVVAAGTKTAGAYTGDYADDKAYFNAMFATKGLSDEYRVDILNGGYVVTYIGGTSN